MWSEYYFSTATRALKYGATGKSTLRLTYTYTMKTKCIFSTIIPVTLPIGFDYKDPYILLIKRTMAALGNRLHLVQLLTTFEQGLR